MDLLWVAFLCIGDKYAALNLVSEPAFMVNSENTENPRPTTSRSDGYSRVRYSDGKIESHTTTNGAQLRPLAHAPVVGCSVGQIQIAISIRCHHNCCCVHVYQTPPIQYTLVLLSHMTVPLLLPCGLSTKSTLIA